MPANEAYFWTIYNPRHSARSLEIARSQVEPAPERFSLERGKKDAGHYLNRYVSCFAHVVYGM